MSIRSDRLKENKALFNKKSDQLNVQNLSVINREIINHLIESGNYEKAEELEEYLGGW